MHALAPDLPLLAVIVLLFGGAVVLSAAEAALLRVSRVRVAVRAGQGDSGARRLLPLIDDLPRVLNAVLLCTLLCQVGAATATGKLAQRHFNSGGVTLASVALTVLMFVYAEAIPKTFAVRNPLQVSMLLGPMAGALAWGLRPIVSVLIAFADLQAPGKGITAHRAFSEQELRALAAEAAASGRIEVGDLDLIERAFRLGDIGVSEILVPRPDIIALSADAAAREGLDLALTTGHRRIPVYEGSLDNVIGLVRLRDLARAVAEGHADRARDLCRPVLVVPEQKPVIALLREMQRSTTHFAIVVDEHGSLVGLVTIEDIVVELVGAVADEGEVPHRTVRAVGQGVWEVEGRATLCELSEALQVELPEGDWTTAAGLVLAHAGSIPKAGHTVDIAGLRWTVLNATRQRVRLLRVER